jgi:hypothetical protein
MIGGPYNGPYTDDPRDPRNFNSPSYSYYNSNPNYPGGTDPNNPASPYYNPDYVHVPDHFGGPYNGYYSDNPRDPRNFNAPGYTSMWDPNNPSGGGNYNLNYVWIPDLVGGPYNAYYSEKPYWFPSGDSMNRVYYRDGRSFNHPNYVASEDQNNPGNPYYNLNYIFPF